MGKYKTMEELSKASSENGKKGNRIRWSHFNEDGSKKTDEQIAAIEESKKRVAELYTFKKNS